MTHPGTTHHDEPTVSAGDVLPAPFHAFLASLAEGDLAKTRAAWEPDGVLEFPYGGSSGVPAQLEGVEAIVAYLSGNIFSDWSFSDLRGWRLSGTPDGFLAELHGSAIVRATGAPYEQDYIIRFELAPSGRIARWREFWDPTRF